MPPITTFKDAIIARNNLAITITLAAKSNNGLKKVVGVIAARNTKTGRIETAVKYNTCKGGDCAEDLVYRALTKKLNAKPGDVEFTTMYRPNKTNGSATKVPVCNKCEGKYGRDAFKEDGVRFQSDGAKNTKFNLFEEN